MLTFVSVSIGSFPLGWQNCMSQSLVQSQNQQLRWTGMPCVPPEATVDVAEQLLGQTSCHKIAQGFITKKRQTTKKLRS